MDQQHLRIRKVLRHFSQRPKIKSGCHSLTTLAIVKKELKPKQPYRILRFELSLFEENVDFRSSFITNYEIQANYGCKQLILFTNVGTVVIKVMRMGESKMLCTVALLLT